MNYLLSWQVMSKFTLKKKKINGSEFPRKFRKEKQDKVPPCNQLLAYHKTTVIKALWFKNKHWHMADTHKHGLGPKYALQSFRMLSYLFCIHCIPHTVLELEAEPRLIRASVKFQHRVKGKRSNVRTYLKMLV